MIEEGGTLLKWAKKGPNKIKAMFKRRKDGHGAGGKSSQVTDNVCQKTNKDNLSIYEFMRKIKSGSQILRALRQENTGTGNLAGCNMSSTTGLKKKMFYVLA